MKLPLFVKVTPILLFLFSKLWGEGFNQKNDVQLWAYQGHVVEINPKTHLYFDTEFRWGNDISEVYFSYLQFFVGYSVTDWLIVRPGYRQIAALRPETRETIPIYNPLLDVVFNFKMGDWEVRDRIRTQYLILESDPNSWQYRNRVKLISPWKWGKMQFNPFIFDEIFFIDVIGLRENRLCFGGRFSPTKGLASDLFYTLRHIKFPNWRPTHIYGIYLTFTY